MTSDSLWLSFHSNLLKTTGFIQVWWRVHFGRLTDDVQSVSFFPSVLFSIVFLFTLQSFSPHPPSFLFLIYLLLGLWHTNTHTYTLWNSTCYQMESHFHPAVRHGKDCPIIKEEQVLWHCEQLKIHASNSPNIFIVILLIPYSPCVIHDHMQFKKRIMNSSLKHFCSNTATLRRIIHTATHVKVCEVHKKHCSVCFQPGSMVTPGKLSIQLTAMVNSVASRTPPMREWIFKIVCNISSKIVCQIYIQTAMTIHMEMVIKYGSHGTLSWMIPSNLSPHIVSILCFHRNKAILFYFNILKCASPAVLINLQCPTTQVRDWGMHSLAAQIHTALCSSPIFSSTLDYARLMGFLIKRTHCLLQLCVSKCPDRFSTLLDAWNTKNWEYYKQFCKPGFKIGRKVRDDG